MVAPASSESEFTGEGASDESMRGVEKTSEGVVGVGEGQPRKPVVVATMMPTPRPRV